MKQDVKVKNETIARPGLTLPGTLTATAWEVPAKLSEAEWCECMRFLGRAEGGTQWWLGDGWNAAIRYGEGKAIAAKIGMDYWHLANCGSVAAAYEFSLRNENLSFEHHRLAMAAEGVKERLRWLKRAVKGDEGEPWSAATLRRQIKHALAGIKAGEKFEIAVANKLATVLYADPPWKYDNTGIEGAAEDHYPPMSENELCTMPTSSPWSRMFDQIAAEAALFLWVTNPLLPVGLSVMAAWGFEYKTNFVWVKPEPMNSIGFYNRGQHELLLLGTRGSFLPEGAIRALPPSVIAAPKAEHSRKPVEAYELIEGLYERFIPTMREVFCRGKGRDGWLPPVGNQAT